MEQVKKSMSDIMGNEFSEYGQSDQLKSFWKYREDEESLVAYNKEIIGLCMLIKGKRDYFGFVSIHSDDLHFGGYGYKCCRVYKLDEVLRLLGNKPTVINEALWGKFQKVQLAKAFAEGTKEKK